MIRFVLFLLLVSLIYVGASSKRGWFDYRRMVERNTELLIKISEVQKQKELLEHQIRALQSDREEQERMESHVLGYVRPNETVIEFRQFPTSRRKTRLLLASAVFPKNIVAFGPVSVLATLLPKVPMDWLH